MSVPSKLDPLSNYAAMAALLCALILQLSIMAWLYQDARRRGKSTLWACLLALCLTGPGALLLWNFLRPDVDPAPRAHRRGDPDAGLKQRANDGLL